MEDDQEVAVKICSITISYPGMQTYQANEILLDVSEEELKELIIGEFIGAYPIDHTVCETVDVEKLQVEISVDSRKIISPIIFVGDRYCAKCGYSASEAKVENDMFLRCGRCGTPTSVRLKKPE